MLVTSSDRRHQIDVHEQDPTAHWPLDAIDQWWRACKRSDERPEYVALRVLDQWKYAGGQGQHLLMPAFEHFQQQTGAAAVALPLDSISYPALCGLSTTNKIRNAAVVALQVRRANDSTTTNVAFTGTDVTTADIGAWCTTNNGFMSRWYDQGANAIYVDNAAGFEPQIYTGATHTLKTLSNGKFGADFNGANQRLGKTTLFGLTGSPALTIAWAYQQSDPDSWPWWFGGTGTGGFIAPDFYDVGRVTGGNGAFREFTYASPIASPARWVVTKAAGGTPSGYACYQNETALAQASLVNGSQAMNIVAGGGLRVGSDLGDFECCAMVESCFAMFNGVLIGADRTALDAMLKLHVP
jgi:hypothetical protein